MSESKSEPFWNEVANHLPAFQARVIAFAARLSTDQRVSRYCQRLILAGYRLDGSKKPGVMAWLMRNGHAGFVPSPNMPYYGDYVRNGWASNEYARRAIAGMDTHTVKE